MYTVATPAPPASLKEIEPELREITEPYLLGVHLGIPTNILDQIRKDHPNDVSRQKTEVVNYWLRNCDETTWSSLAIAIEELGGHQKLVTRLRKLASQQSSSAIEIESSELYKSRI